MDGRQHIVEVFGHMEWAGYQSWVNIYVYTNPPNLGTYVHGESNYSPVTDKTGTKTYAPVGHYKMILAIDNNDEPPVRAATKEETCVSQEP
jgi:hypothetical protein